MSLAAVVVAVGEEEHGARPRRTGGLDAEDGAVVERRALPLARQLADRVADCRRGRWSARRPRWAVSPKVTRPTRTSAGTAARKAAAAFLAPTIPSPCHAAAVVDGEHGGARHGAWPRRPAAWPWPAPRRRPPRHAPTRDRSDCPAGSSRRPGRRCRRCPRRWLMATMRPFGSAAAGPPVRDQDAGDAQHDAAEAEHPPVIARTSRTRRRSGRRSRPLAASLSRNLGRRPVDFSVPSERPLVVEAGAVVEQEQVLQGDDVALHARRPR